MPYIILSRNLYLPKITSVLLFLLIPLIDVVASTDTLGTYHVQWKDSPDTLPIINGSNLIIHTIENGVFDKSQPFYRLVLPEAVGEVQLFNPFYGPIPYDLQKVAVTENLQSRNINVSFGRQSSLVDIPVLKYDEVLQEWLALQKFNLIVESIDQGKSSARKTNGSVNSVLATGNWVKLAIIEEGIYQLDYQYLQNIGLDVDRLNPKHIKIYGNGGKMLPQSNATARPKDLVENAIWISGESDEVFNSNDFILFYGQRSDLLTYDTLTGDWNWQNNDYSDTTFYFLTVDDTPGLRVKIQNATSSGSVSYNYYDDAYVHEIDKYNLLEEDLVTNAGSGRNWLGQKLSSINSSLNLQLPVDNIMSAQPATVKVKMVSNSLQAADLNINLNGSNIGTINLPAIPNGRYSVKGILEQGIFTTIDPPSGPLQISINYINPASSASIVYLDNLLFTYRRKLLYNGFFKFRVLESFQHEFVRYDLTAGETIDVWDISDASMPRKVTLQPRGNGYSFSANSDRLREFIVFSSADFLKPVNYRTIENQNLHEDLSPEMVIITHPLFKNAANQLAQFRGTHDQINVKVVTTEQVYNEFAGGSTDITAFRDYMKYLYDNGNIRYLLLFGKCSYDFKNILAESNSNATANFVPTYQSRNSFHPIFSYSSDDYFGFLDDNEGEWVESSSGDHLMDIGVGRLPATTREEAKIMVEKIIAYDTQESVFGNWRKKIQFVADDEDFNTHQKDADILAEFLSENFTDLDLNKIYLDAFPQQTTSFGERVPGVNQALQEAVDQGALIVNFTGHGSEIQWTDEKVLDNIVIEEFGNDGKLPLFVTATCEFGRHDNPVVRSGAEQLLINPGGGAIGLVTTARPVYSNTNFQLNRAFYQSAFQPIEGRMPRLGDIFKYTKNNSLSGSVNRNFSLLGDPSMRLAYPENRIEVEEINSIGSDSDTIRALDKIQIKGIITNSAGTKLSGFDGELFATVFDKPRTITTIGNKSPKMTFLQRDHFLFQGKATVEKGQFNLTFPVPKNINYQFGQGKISFYANSNNKDTDATGYINKIVGGSVNQPVTDNEPPKIELFINDTLFNNGDVSGPNPLLLARISDESGINISSSGIGQDLIARLNREKSYVLNKFFVAELDDYSSGWVEYQLNNLPEGDHVLELKAWDTYNNASTAKIEFWIGDLKELILSELKNFPNPFQQKTNIIVGHNKAGLSLDVSVNVYNSEGKMVLEDYIGYNQADSRINLEWEGLDARGNKLPPGIYILRMSVRCLEDGSQNAATTKLLIIN